MKKIVFTIAIIFACFSAKSADVIITTPTIWSSNMTINDNVRILQGGTLTINNNAVIEIGGFIETRSSTPVGTWGGKLILENCTVKGIVSSTWTGISIIGDKNLSQNDIRMSRLNIIDNVLIKGAACGISNFDFTFDPGAVYSGGGIIKAYGVTIEQSHFCVRMNHYQNFNPTVPSIKYNDLSAFTNCIFKKTSGGWVSSELVVLDEVEGVRFQGCSFQLLLPGMEKYRILTE